MGKSGLQQRCLGLLQRCLGLLQRCLGLLQRCLGLLQRLGAKWRLGAKIGIFFFKYPDIFFGLNLSASSKTASEFLSEPPGGRNRNPVTRSVRSSPYPEPGR